jgi:plasmid stabilization system protein ParE
VKVKVTRRAERRIEIVDRFWRKNRLEAPDLLKEELAAAEVRLSEDPYAGKACVIGERQLRRLLLPRTEQWMYYVVRAKQGLVVVQTIWGARRGRDPKI